MNKIGVSEGEELAFTEQLVLSVENTVARKRNFCIFIELTISPCCIHVMYKNKENSSLKECITK